MRSVAQSEPAVRRMRQHTGHAAPCTTHQARLREDNKHTCALTRGARRGEGMGVCEAAVGSAKGEGRSEARSGEGRWPSEVKPGGALS